MASKEEQGPIAHSYEESEDSTSDNPDAKEMRAMGKSQQFRRNFEFWSILGLSCCTMITWAGQLITFIQGLSDGGPEGLVISLFVTWTAMAAIIASLAELMSMWPTSGGQYHCVKAPRTRCTETHADELLQGHTPWLLRSGLPSSATSMAGSAFWRGRPSLLRPRS